jgi:hypothetical protein
MKKYCYIKNGRVELRNKDLPISWSNVSNFNLLPDTILKTYGWLPYVVESENKPEFVKTEDIIEEDVVREVITTRDMTEQEIEQENLKQLELEWDSIRQHRDDLLKKSDILVLIDKWELLSEEEKNKIRNYRQLLRDIPQSFNIPSDVVWPIL